MSHTQGKLKYFSTEDGLCRINPENGGLIVAECSVRNPFDVEQTENARRLVACWNAFDGVLTEDVEAIIGMDSFIVKFNEYKSQRDELLEALEALLESEWQDDEGHPRLEKAREKARASIAKVKGANL